jgi:hypothetical protein
MTTSDYLLNIGLIGLVVVQMRGRRLNPVTLLLPLAAVSWAAVTYLHSFPTAGNDLVLELGAAVVGLALGVGCALTTRLTRTSDGSTIAKAGVVAAALWIVGVGSRLAFEIAVTHGGMGAIGRFSASHDITSAQAWVTGLILMSIAEVGSRTAGLYIRSWRAGRSVATAAPAGRSFAGAVAADASSVG